MNPTELSEVLSLHSKWLLGDADGTRADLRDADLSNANLRSANLRDADLSNANLRSANLGDADLSNADLRDADLSNANLRSANLRDADLSYANLRDADLRNADLRDANLGFANLRNANLRDANLGDVLWSEYILYVVPALLTAGGKALHDVATQKVWACHSWMNGELACPIGTAFDCSSLDGVPPLYRQQAARFIQFFDAGLIPLPEMAETHATQGEA